MRRELCLYACRPAPSHPCQTSGNPKQAPRTSTHQHDRPPSHPCTRALCSHLQQQNPRAQEEDAQKTLVIDIHLSCVQLTRRRGGGGKGRLNAVVARSGACLQPNASPLQSLLLLDDRRAERRASTAAWRERAVERRIVLRRGTPSTICKTGGGGPCAPLLSSKCAPRLTTNLV